MKRFTNVSVVSALLGATLLLATACGDDEGGGGDDDGGDTGGTNTGGTNTGGTNTGGTSGSTTGGSAGKAPTGGSAGTATGGSAGTPAGGAGGANGGSAGAPGGSGPGGAGGTGAGAGGVGGGAGGAGGGAGGSGGMMCKSPLPAPMGGMGGMGGIAGAGGMAAGAGGMAAGAGGAAAGAGGVAAGAGGAAAGAGGVAAGAGGAAAGAGGAAAGASSVGGAGGAAPVLPRVIATFDTPGSLNMSGIGNWIPGGSPPIPDTVVSRNATEGVSCVGAAELRVPFTAYGQQQDVQINFNPLQNWTGATMLRAKVKIVMPSTGNLNHLAGIQFAANSKTNYSTFQGHYYNASTFADGAWHDVDLPVPGTSGTPLSPTEVIQISVQVITQATAPTTGPAAPVTTTVLLDDVWLQ